VGKQKTGRNLKKIKDKGIVACVKNERKARRAGVEATMREFGWKIESTRGRGEDRRGKKASKLARIKRKRMTLNGKNKKHSKDTQIAKRVLQGEGDAEPKVGPLGFGAQ